MTHSIKHLFHIDASIEKVYEAITTIEGLQNWWTIETAGDPSLGGSISFGFAENGGQVMKVTEMIENKFLSWECLTSDHGWAGHTFIFELDQNDGKTRVRFSHKNWEDNGDFFAVCTFGWGRFMESLRQLCQTDKGQAFGTEGYI